MPSNLYLLVLLSLLTASGSSFATSLYKWVDEEGNTHFSQTPPKQEESSASVGQVQLRDSRTIKPTKVGRKLYCGEDPLEIHGSSPAVKIANLQQYVLDRQRESERLQARRLKVVEDTVRYKSSTLNSDEELRRYDKRIGVEQCKLEWAEAELAGMGGEKLKVADRMRNVEAGIAEMEQQKVTRCGVDDRTGVIVVDEEYKAYQQCIKPFDREIEKLQRELKKAERDQKLIDGL